MKVLADSKEETAAVAEAFLASLVPSYEEATVVSLVGDLGAGKTTFTQGLAWALGVEERVTSPTFVIQKIYKLPAQAKFKHLIHIDCYRLESEAELEHLGFKELLTDPGNLVVIEWPSKVGLAIPKSAKEVKMRFIDDVTREIDYAD